MPSDEIRNRRIKVHELMDSGLTNREIADQLGISTSTVSSDKKAINAHPDDYIIKQESSEPVAAESERSEEADRNEHETADAIADEKPVESSKHNDGAPEEEQPSDEHDNVSNESNDEKPRDAKEVADSITSFVNAGLDSIANEIADISKTTRERLGVHDDVKHEDKNAVETIPDKHDNPIIAPVHVPEREPVFNDDFITRILGNGDRHAFKAFKLLPDTDKWDLKETERSDAFIRGVLTGGLIIAIAAIILNIIF